MIFWYSRRSAWARREWTAGPLPRYSARCDEFRTEEGQRKAANTCKLLGLDGIVAIGGDGTFRGALALSRQAADRGYRLQVVGIPATIDNDIGCSHYTIGFDTAFQT